MGGDVLTVSKKTQGFLGTGIGLLCFSILIIACSDQPLNRFQLLPREETFLVGEVADRVIKGSVPEVQLYFLDLSGSMGPHIKRFSGNLIANIISRYEDYEADPIKNSKPDLVAYFFSHRWLLASSSVYLQAHICGATTLPNCGFPAGVTPGEIMTEAQIASTAQNLGNNFPLMAGVSTRDSNGELVPKQDILSKLKDIEAAFIALDRGAQSWFESTIMAAKVIFDLNKDGKLLQMIKPGASLAYIMVTDEDDQAEESPPFNSNVGSRFSTLDVASVMRKTFQVPDPTGPAGATKPFDYAWKVSSKPNYVDANGNPLDPNKDGFYQMDYQKFTEDLKTHAKKHNYTVSAVAVGIKELPTLLKARAGIDIFDPILTVSELLTLPAKKLYYDRCTNCEKFISYFSGNFSLFEDIGNADVFSKTLTQLQNNAKWLANQIPLKFFIDPTKSVTVRLVNENGSTILVLKKGLHYQLSPNLDTILLDISKLDLTNPNWRFVLNYTPSSLIPTGFTARNF